MNEFLSFLAANDFEKRIHTLPDEAYDPNLDENLADHYSDMAEFENQEYYLLNGFERDGDMEVELKKLFNQFKIYAYENKIKEQQEFRNEIITQVLGTVKAIEEGIRRAKALESEGLIALYNKKLSYSRQTINLLQSEEPDEKKVHRGSKVFYSYKWLIDADALIPKAYHLMVGKWINKNTTLEQFRNVFSEKPIGECRPIWWYEDAINGLVLFVGRLKERNVISDWNKKDRLNIQLLTACFRNASGSEFSNKSIKSTKYGVKKEISPQKKDAIDDLVHRIIS